MPAPSPKALAAAFPWAAEIPFPLPVKAPAEVPAFPPIAKEIPLEIPSERSGLVKEVLAVLA